MTNVIIVCLKKKAQKRKQREKKKKKNLTIKIKLYFSSLDPSSSPLPIRPALASSLNHHPINLFPLIRASNHLLLTASGFLFCSPRLSKVQHLPSG